MGHGLFATESFKLGEFVIEYTGRKITAELADKLETRYLFEINKYWTIDGSVRTNIARYVNHSCNPNCEADIKKGRILFTAIRDIEKGEELTIDYGEEYFDEFIKPHGCKCPACMLGRTIVAAV
jgi:SET domain-containing protein